MTTPFGFTESSTPPAPHLTPRQRDVLELLCEGHSNKSIARHLNTAAATVKVHVSNILRAFGVRSRLEAVLAAHRLGLSIPRPIKTPRFPGRPDAHLQPIEFPPTSRPPVTPARFVEVLLEKDL